MAATTSSSCSSFFNLRSTPDEPSVRTTSTHGLPGRGKLDGVAMWFINGLASAFFGSLERCSCIRITTEDDGDEANDAPLIYNDGNYLRPHDGGGGGVTRTISRRKTWKGK